MSGHEVDPELLETWRSARLWIELPRSGGTEIIPGEGTDPSAFPRAADAVHLISAWNPGGRELARGENDERDAELVGLLEERGLEHWAAAGYSADHSWLERGFALPDAGRVTAREIAARFGQLAIYEWTRSALAIVECADGAVTATSGWSSRPLADAPGT